MDLVEIKEGNVNRHPWEYSRADSLLKILEQFPKDAQYADVGAGDVYFATRLAEKLTKKVYVVDTGYTETGEKGKLIQLTNIKDLPENSIDVVLLMDVIEHIDDVDSFLTELMTRIKPGGRVLITVPAHQFLFSQHDVFLLHYRRYNLKLLRDTVKKQDLIIENSFYFYTSLFFARCLAVFIEKMTKPKKADGVGNWGHPEDAFLTKVIRGILNLDFNIGYFFGKLHLSLPGLSVSAVCRKKS